eukprot:356820-Chlamydomonas_euryale.AAC.2
MEVKAHVSLSSDSEPMSCYNIGDHLDVRSCHRASWGCLQAYLLTAHTQLGFLTGVPADRSHSAGDADRPTCRESTLSHVTCASGRKKLDAEETR